MKFTYILFCKLPFCRFIHSLCENETFLCEESTLPHNKRNRFPSCLDHYLMKNDKTITTKSGRSRLHEVVIY